MEAIHYVTRTPNLATLFLQGNFRLGGMLKFDAEEAMARYCCDSQLGQKQDGWSSQDAHPSCDSSDMERFGHPSNFTEGVPFL